MPAIIPGYEKIALRSCQVNLVHGGGDYFKLLLDLINKATEIIHLQTYIFQDDETGQLVADALISATQRNVDVYLLVDGYASQRLPEIFIRKLRNAGIHFRFFEPLFKSRNFYFGRRMHHKIFVADAAHALVGGINIANRYNNINGKNGWMDFAAYVKGTTATELCKICWETWERSPSKANVGLCINRQYDNDSEDVSLTQVHVKRNDWVRHKNEISSSYISMFHHAKAEITIMCSYFLPGKIIRRLLRNASKRGVKISVIIAGTSDIRISKYAERWLYDWMLRNKIELYEYQPTVLHAKIAVADNEWLTVGSYNINNISTYASIELNVDIMDADLATQTKQQLDTIIANDCIKVKKKGRRYSENIFVQFMEWCSFLFIRMIFFLFTFYFKQSRVS